MNGMPPDLTGTGAMGGRMLSHPMFDRNAGTATADAAAAAGASYADALLNSRYGASAQVGASAASASAAGAGVNFNAMLQHQQDLRRHDALNSSAHSYHAHAASALNSSGHGYAGAGAAFNLNSSGHGYAAAASADALGSSSHSVAMPGHDAALLAHREEELVRLHDEHNRIMKLELSARAMRDRIAAQSSQSQSHPQVAQSQARQPPAQDESFRADSIERIVALQEQQALRQREIEKLKQAELSEQSRLGLLPVPGAAQLSSPPMGERERLLGSASGHGYSGGLDGSTHSLPPGSAHSLPLGLGSSSHHSLPPAMMRQEMALLEQMRLQRRMVEEEAIKQEAIKRHQQAEQEQQAAAMNSQARRMSGGEMPASDREHLSRLLQLQKMSDEDLIRRAAEVQSSTQRASFRANTERNTNNANASLEQQILEAQLLRSGLQRFQGPGRMDDQRNGLDMIDQAHADDLVSRRMSGMAEQYHHHQGQKSKSPMELALNYSQHSTNNLNMSQHSHCTNLNMSQHSVANNNASMNASQHSVVSSHPQPLRYFNNGVEVDMDGNPLQAPTKDNGNSNRNSTSPLSPPTSRKSITLVPTAQGGFQAAPSSSTSPPSNNNATNNLNDKLCLDNNIIAKFLTVVVSRVPEIAPAIADLLPEQGDPALLKRAFPNVVDATLSELRSLQERLAGATDEHSAGLYKRVTICIAAIEPYKVDMSMAGGLNALPDVAATQPSSVLDPNSCEPLQPNNPMMYAASMRAAATAGEFAMAHQAGSFNSNNGPFFNNSSHSDGLKSTSPMEDNMPMMAAYKSKKKAAKKAKKRKSKGSSSKKNKVPTLVHKGGSFDLNKISANIMEGTVAPASLMSSSNSKLDPPFRKRSGSTLSSESTNTANSNMELKPSSSFASAASTKSADSTKSRPMKKRRISNNKPMVDEHDTIIANPPCPEIKTVVVENGNGNPTAPSGPHGDVLDQLFGGTSVKSEDKEEPKQYVQDESKEESAVPSNNNDNDDNESKQYVEDESKEERSDLQSSISNTKNAYADNAVITDESGHTMTSSKGRDSDNESQHYHKDDDDDGHYGAASVLLGLMGKREC